MPEDTEIIAKPEVKATEQTTVATATTHPLPESHFCNISIRAYLAIMVVGTMCSITAYQVYKTGTLDESFKVAYGLVIGLYFGQKK